MKGTKIELEERRHRHHQQHQIAKRDCELDEYPTYTTSKYCNSYSFRFEKPYRRNVEKPNLSVTKIEFPTGVPALNTGTSLVRWTQKRAKFKHKSKATVPKMPENAEEPLLEINNNNGRCDSEMQDGNDETEEEIDCDVAQLILAAADFHEEEEERPQKKRKSKGVRFALSKPQSPQSIQVIRVDVTSSYEEDESSCEDYRERFQNLVDEREEDDDGKDSKEFEIVCQKLALLPRE